MAARREIREGDLLEHARCLLRRPEQAPYVQPADLLAAESAAKKLILQTFTQDRMPDAGRSREFYDEAWRETVGFDPELKPPRAGLSIVRRLRDLLERYEIWQPVTKYTLNLGKAMVTGEYAVVVDRKRRKDGLQILRWRHKRERVERQMIQSVDVVNWARWLHLRNHESPARELHVLNVVLDSEELWKDVIQAEKQVRGSLSYLVESVVEEKTFPSPGVYCRNCRTHACERPPGLITLR